MLNIFTTILIIAVVFFFLGVCIFIHELGHLLVAKWRGLYVERFSIGLGKKIWGFWFKDIEFVVSWLPFGGYVALPQMDSTHEPEDRNGEKLPPASAKDRILTAVSGPLSNVVLGFALGMIVWFAGVYEPMPKENYVVADFQDSLPEGREVSPEYEAGLRTGDTITKINGEDVPENWQDMVQKILYSTEQVSLTVRRNGDIKIIRYKPEDNPKHYNAPYPFFSLEVPVIARMVVPDKPAAKAGIKEGDRFLQVNGEEVNNPTDFKDTIWESDGKPISLVVERNNNKIEFSSVQTVQIQRDGKEGYIIGVMPSIPQQLVHKDPWTQFVDIMKMTGNTLTAVVNPKSSVSVDDLSGPVGIVTMNYKIIRHQGWRKGLWFVVLITFNLAVINLLPIPVLDGGHILFGVIETVIRRRIPPKLGQIVQTACLVLILGFFLYVTLNDINRFFIDSSSSDKDGKDEQTENAEEPKKD